MKQEKVTFDDKKFPETPQKMMKKFQLTTKAGLKVRNHYMANGYKSGEVANDSKQFSITTSKISYIDSLMDQLRSIKQENENIAKEILQDKPLVFKKNNSGTKESISSADEFISSIKQNISIKEENYSKIKENSPMDEENMAVDKKEFDEQISIAECKYGEEKSKDDEIIHGHLKIHL